MNVWIDIDNPPQVQYMTPFIPAFERRGCTVSVTARDYQITHELLNDRGVAHRLIGHELGASKWRKWSGTLRRSARLAVLHARSRPDVLVSMARSAAITSWAMRIPAFTVVDYEYQELRSFGACGVTVLHPDVIPPESFAAAGVSRDRLVPFTGIKEDLSFSRTDIDGTPGHDFGVDRGEAVLVLVRPPSEISTYASSASRDFNSEILRRLAAHPELQVVFSPRHRSQAEEVRSLEWRRAPIVLEKPIEFVSLLKGVDWVLCGGGTMLREAAYLGVPAISTFRSKLGAVDAWLESTGAIRLMESPADVDAIPWRERPGSGIVRQNRGLVDELAGLILSRVGVGRQPRGVS